MARVSGATGKPDEINPVSQSLSQSRKKASKGTVVIQVFKERLRLCMPSAYPLQVYGKNLLGSNWLTQPQTTTGAFTMEGRRLPTIDQAIECVYVCQMLSNLLQDIHLFRFDEPG